VGNYPREVLVFHRLLIVLTLAGLVLTGAAMTAHASGSAHPVDVVAASAHSPIDHSSLTESLSGSVSASVSGWASAVMPAVCLDCGSGDLVNDHAMLMALGCVFVAMIAAALVVSARSWGLLGMLERRLLIAPVVAALAVAVPPPNLLALGISRT